MKQKRNILVIRLSAMGDAAISAPLVRAYASANPDCNFYMVSQPRFEAMFSYPAQRCAPLLTNGSLSNNACKNYEASSQDAVTETHDVKSEHLQTAEETNISNLHYIPLNTKHGAPDYCGSWKGLIKFARTVKREYGITHFADIHDVLRTKLLRITLRLCGVKVAKINKHRKERAALCRQNNKKFVQIIKSQRCMEEVFVKLGLKDLHFTEENAGKSKERAKAFSNQETVSRKVIKIGIAPFAGHKGKEWPTEKMEEVVKYFAEHSTTAIHLNDHTKEIVYKIYLFGGGKREIEIMQPWADKYPNTELFAGKHTLHQELESMAALDVMVSMDSANMHLASLVGTPVVCVWGATHKFAGYNGWGQKDENAVEANLPCRPCSIFGAKKCFKTETPYACLNMVTPQMVIEKIIKVLAGC